MRKVQRFYGQMWGAAHMGQVYVGSLFRAGGAFFG